MERRQFLATSGIALGSLLAGCLGDSAPENGGSDGDGDGDGDGNGDGLEYEVVQAGTSLPAPAWYDDGEPPGAVILVESSGQVPVPVGDLPADLREWIRATDFEESVLAFVQSVGPDTCHSEVDVADLAIEGDTLVGTARAVDTSGEGEACGSAVTFPSAFVRVSAADLPTRAEFTVTDGWGESATVTTDGPLVDPAALPGGVRPDGDPPQVAGTLACDDPDFERHWTADDPVVWGEATDDEGDPTIALRVQESSDGTLSFERGEEVRIEMTNVSRRPQATGNRHKYGLEVLTEAEGWTEVRGTSDGDPLEYTDEAINHPPGEGFEWTLAMTEEGVVEGHVHENHLEVCPDLPAGRYRFVFWGAIGESIAVAFHLEG